MNREGLGHPGTVGEEAEATAERGVRGGLCVCCWADRHRAGCEDFDFN